MQRNNLEGFVGQQTDFTGLHCEKEAAGITLHNDRHLTGRAGTLRHQLMVTVTLQLAVADVTVQNCRGVAVASGAGSM